MLNQALEPARETEQAEQVAANPIIVDGFLIDPDTGEVLGMAELPKPEFHVTDKDDAEWVLQKLTDADSEIARLELVKASVAARLDSQIKAVADRRKFLISRFGDELEDFAKKNLPNGKRTWTGTWGSIAFTKTNARLDVADTTKALAWLKRSEKEAIKIEVSVLKSKISPKAVEAMLNKPELAISRGFTVVPANENVKIATVGGAKK